jgi:hypothetical protein
MEKKAGEDEENVAEGESKRRKKVDDSRDSVAMEDIVDSDMSFANGARLLMKMVIKLEASHQEIPAKQLAKLQEMVAGMLAKHQDLPLSLLSNSIGVFVFRHTSWYCF